jgi:putative selenate reductase molybdopterin-binding subunit
VLSSPPSRVRCTQADTDSAGYDTSQFGSAGTVVAGKAAEYAAVALRDRILNLAAKLQDTDPAKCRITLDAVVCDGSSVALTDLAAAARSAGQPLEVVRKAYGSPRSVAFNCHGFRIAVHRITAGINILQSVQATDAGVVINPSQLRGQLEGAISQGLGALRDYGLRRTRRGSQSFFPQLPNSSIRRCSAQRNLFRRYFRCLGPLGAKSMSEAPINPVAPALANADADATGIRFGDLPLRPDRIYRRIYEALAGSVRAN